MQLLRSLSLAFVGVGVAARDANGVLLCAAALRIPGKFPPHAAECLALREGGRMIARGG
ncbi:hypothetical protein TIFTF001_033314 [Ficus carica]|uniref:Uncharacterized protein n=1 Tax=Ficus carica TaxID=3494 RepID=A0AA88DYL9_FICCA|nr:hypothetical protein TIFTF001_033314 [Ficus carica]